MVDRGAVLFDLDDTLYPLDQFVTSGFRAVAALVENEWGLPRAVAFEILAGAVTTTPGRELQALAARLGDGRAIVPQLLDALRNHTPDLRLPEQSRAVLAAVRRRCRVGIVTNGRPDIQARKVQALGLTSLVDTVVFAHDFGAGKPEAAPFLEACRRLAVLPAEAVFVGDDPICDIAGAQRVGMQTIWLPRRVALLLTEAAAPADVIVAALADVPAVAARLLAPEWRAHVA